MPPADLSGRGHKKELVLRPRRMYFLPPAFNFFPPQNVKKNLKQFHINPNFLVCFNSELYYVHLQSVCVYWYASQWQVSIHITLTKKWCDEGDRKEGKTDDVLSFVVSDICWGNNHPPMECSGGGGWCYSTGASVGDLYTSICNGSVGTGWELPAKYKDFSVKASIGRSKTSSFDNVMLSVSVLEAVALFGTQFVGSVRIKKPRQKENTICSKKKKIQEKLSCIVQNFAVCLVTKVRLKIYIKKNLPACLIWIEKKWP